MAKTQMDNETVEIIVIDINNYLNGNEDQFLITQQIVGFKLIFCG